MIFIDSVNKVIYEIKPNSMKYIKINKIKDVAAKNWAFNNNYEYKVISEDWFNKNYNESILINQPDKAKISNSLKKFQHEN